VENAVEDPEYRAGIVDLLGALGLGELSAFQRLAADAELAPTLSDQAALAGMAAAEYRHFERIRDRLADLGVSVDDAMGPFREPYATFHAKTAPSTWLEGLVKAYVGDQIGIDFYGYVWHGQVDRPRQSWDTPPNVEDNVAYYDIMDQYYTPERYRWDESAACEDRCGAPERYRDQASDTARHRSGGRAGQWDLPHGVGSASSHWRGSG
jgi:hypothetical protein